MYAITYQSRNKIPKFELWYRVRIGIANIALRPLLAKKAIAIGQNQRCIITIEFFLPSAWKAK